MATDAHANPATGQFTVTVRDTTAPALTLPADITAEAISAKGAPVSFTATALDVVDGAVTVTCDPASGSMFALGSTPVACTTTDAAGNIGKASFSLTVRDTTAPAITGTPSNIYLEATGANGAVATYTAPTASDAVDGDGLNVTCHPASGSTFNLDDMTTVTCSATDAARNTGSSSFAVKVGDKTKPAIVVPGPIKAEATSSGGAVVTFTTSAIDVVDGSVPVSCRPGSGSTFALGLTSVACSAEDTHKNTASGSFPVTVVDTTAPALTMPADQTIEATGPNGAKTAFNASAHDIVEGDVAVTCDASTGDMFTLGATTVHCTATDKAGNQATREFVVKVVDSTAPSITVPADMTATATGPNGAAVTFTTSANDLVGGTIAVACTPASGSTFKPGTTTVTCTATDGAGNVGSTSFKVNVGFNAGGFLQPVNPNPAVRNTVKGGSTVPLKWQVRNPTGSYFGDIGMVSSFTTTKLTCSTLAATEEPVEITTTGGTVLRYSDSQFIQNWQTPKAPGSCYRAAVTLTDGTTISAVFELK
jgi:hypothetical protein